MERFRIVLAGGLVLSAAAWMMAGEDEPPPLPQGPAATRPADDDEPPPPAGPDQERPPADQTVPARKWLELTGFWEVRGGVRTQRDRHERQASIGETRLQLEAEKQWDGLGVKLVADLLYDAVRDRHCPRLETGGGLVDLRQAHVSLSPLPFLDARIGRQVLTWGTGDLVFLNDLFPKDWPSFFVGRDVEYLKAPSDAAKISIFTDLADLDVVFTPRFDADRFITGKRISYWNGALGRRAGRDAVVDVEKPDECFRDHEWAARISKNVRGTELAAYGYWGYWKSPAGTNPLNGKATFPRLSVYGASARGQLRGGIANVEAALYDSRRDRAGDDPSVRNGELRLLMGYERELPEITDDLTVGMQYYVEHMLEYDAYRRGLPSGAKAADQRRHVLTWRVTKLMMDQNLRLSLFAFFSPSDGDAYLRPNLQYKIDDHWTAEVGGNVFFGGHRHTFFAQFAADTNVYAALRYGF